MCESECSALESTAIEQLRNSKSRAVEQGNLRAFTIYCHKSQLKSNKTMIPWNDHRPGESRSKLLDTEIHRRTPIAGSQLLFA